MKRLSAEGPVGDYYEFGLYRGYTFWYAQHAADRAGLATMRFFGFDSFAGLPEIGEKTIKLKAFSFQATTGATRDEVEKQLTEHGFDWSRATLTEGFLMHPSRRKRDRRSEPGPPRS